MAADDSGAGDAASSAEPAAEAAAAATAALAAAAMAEATTFIDGFEAGGLPRDVCEVWRMGAAVIWSELAIARRRDTAAGLVARFFLNRQWEQYATWSLG